MFNELHDMSNQNKFQFNRPCSNFFHISCFSNNCAILNLCIIQNTLSSCLWFFLSLVFQAVHSTVTPYGLKTSCLGAHLDTCTLPFEKHLHFIDQSNSRLFMNTVCLASFELLLSSITSMTMVSFCIIWMLLPIHPCNTCISRKPPPFSF